MKNNKKNIIWQWQLVAYDAVFFALAIFISFQLPNANVLNLNNAIIVAACYFIVLLIIRFILKIYSRIWRYEATGGFIALVLSDTLTAVLFLSTLYAISPLRVYLFFIGYVFCINLLICITARLTYRYLFRHRIKNSTLRKILEPVISFFTQNRISFPESENEEKIKIAVVGAGRTGTSFIHDLIDNPAAFYSPEVIIDIDKYKVGRYIQDIKIIEENEEAFKYLQKHNIDEVVIAIPDLSEDRKKKLLETYKQHNLKVKIFDYSSTYSAGKKKHIRDFDIEDLMPRNPIDLDNKELASFYNSKTVLVTGAGGSIGSEISRQIFKMNPKKIILLDIYENGVYEVQQGFMQSKIKDKCEFCVEICNIVDTDALDRVFVKHKPEIVLHAAAHKHVPLMEHNVIEAIKNNIFGTHNLILAAEKYHVYKFMMISTDKAVNPTNVMGATKRYCEIMVKAFNEQGKVRYGATRFGNVLGSAGSVVPLFKRQIANGGPVTVTDKKVIRYFMTIPEACNLVLEASLMTTNGELFVLDMGSPVRIWDLAENMIKISGVPDIEIKEIGLRPGEKLYEELLLKKSAKHTKTENDLIFIEKEENNREVNEIEKELNELKGACAKGNEKDAKELLKRLVPTFKDTNFLNQQYKDKNKNKQTHH